MNSFEAIKDPMNVSLKIDWNTTKNPLIPNEEFLNKRKLFNTSGRFKILDFEIFDFMKYFKSLNDKLEVDKDYVNYKLNYEDDQKNFTLIQYPYMLSVQTKVVKNPKQACKLQFRQCQCFMIIVSIKSAKNVVS